MTGAGDLCAPRALPGLDMRGVAVHIGSQLSDLEPLEEAFGKMGALMRRSARRAERHPHRPRRRAGRALQGGRGLPSPAEYGAMVARVTADWDVT
jgi:diaminopimelate decarboxylase